MVVALFFAEHRLATNSPISSTLLSLNSLTLDYMATGIIFCFINTHNLDA